MTDGESELASQRPSHMGSWAYPPSEDALEEVRLCIITEYVEVRCQTIAMFIQK